MSRICQYCWIVLLVLLLSSCATLQQAMEFSKVKFSLDHVSDVSVAGINISRMRSPDELNAFQLARAALAFSQSRLPLDLTVHLKTENPLINQVSTTLTQLDWTLLLDGRDTISGRLNSPITLPAGEVQDIPLRLSLNMMDFFEGSNAIDLLDLALAFAGGGGGVPKGVGLKLRPTIETPLGPITYGKALIVQAKN